MDGAAAPVALFMEEGRKWIRLVPINKSHVRKFTENKVTDDIKEMNGKEFEMARKTAAEEFLKIELKITDIEIKETKLSENKDAGILWVKVGNKARLTILSQIAKESIGRQLQIRLLTKIPQQFWSRNKLLEYNCAMERKKNPNLRTQIRLGQFDLELWTKEKGEQFWRLTPLEAFGSLDPYTVNYPKDQAPTQDRIPKRGATSPLTSNPNKLHRRSNSPDPLI